jgi:hypothetical protein
MSWTAWIRDEGTNGQKDINNEEEKSHQLEEKQDVEESS